MKYETLTWASLFAAVVLIVSLCLIEKIDKQQVQINEMIEHEIVQSKMINDLIEVQYKQALLLQELSNK